MPGEDQERFEDYLELEQYIEQLQAGHIAHPPTELTPSQARIYRMAALFRSASPEAAEPRPEFAAELQTHLEQQLQQTQQLESLSSARKQRPGQEKKKRAPISRRALLVGGATVAASLAIGAGIDHALVQTASITLTANTTAYPLVDNSVATTWHFVTTLALLGERAVRFSTDTVVGYIIRDDGNNGDPDKGKIIAMSAACTHMGCIVQWQDADRKFHCPCHGGLFTEYGKVDEGAGRMRYLSPLPRLQTKVENGNVYVEVPKSQK